MHITINNVSLKVKTKSNNKIFGNKYKLNYSNGDKVNDEKRGFLYFDNNSSTWIFCGLSQIKHKKYNNLVLILESPHKSEYDTSGKPLRPANGITGLKINKYLTNQIQPNWKLNKGTIYCVWIVNAIQYQMSGYNQLKNNQYYSKIWHTVRNCAFKTVWENETTFGLQDDLKKRVESIKPLIIINCVTGGKNKYSLQNLVDNVVRSNCKCNHPSVWK